MCTANLLQSHFNAKSFSKLYSASKLWTSPTHYSSPYMKILFYQEVKKSLNKQSSLKVAIIRMKLQIFDHHFEFDQLCCHFWPKAMILKVNNFSLCPNCISQVKWHFLTGYNEQFCSNQPFLSTSTHYWSCLFKFVMLHHMLCCFLSTWI